MFDGRWRPVVERGLRPVGATVRRTGITADHLTATGLAFAAGCAVAVASGRLGLGLALLVASAVPDVLDGAVAKASGTASPRGAFFDSVADRVSDALVLGGIGWYLADVHGGRVAMLAFALLAASATVSYERAKAESLGYSAKGGLMERAERIAAIAIGLAFSSILVPVLAVTLVLTVVTAVHRFVKVWRQASAPRPVAASAARFAPSVRWRAWRGGRRAPPAPWRRAPPGSRRASGGGRGGPPHSCGPPGKAPSRAGGRVAPPARGRGRGAVAPAPDPDATSPRPA